MVVLSGRHLYKSSLRRYQAPAKKIKTNVNADEAAVMGAAFKAASLSASFRVKDIKAYEMSGSAVNLKWSADGKDRSQKLFPPRPLKLVQRKRCL